METKMPIELANENQNPNGIVQWKPQPQFNHKNQMELANENQNPNGMGQWKPKPQLTHKKKSISLFPYAYSQSSF